MAQKFLMRMQYYLDALQRFVRSMHPLMLIIGAEGSGKRLLVDTFCEALHEPRLLRLEAHASLSAQQFIDFICEQWSLEQTQQQQSIRTQLDQLLAATRDHTPNIIIFNNAEKLNIHTLAACMHLANQQQTHTVSIHLLLVGEAILTDKIASLTLQTPAQLILQPLSKKETFDYVQYRLTKLDAKHVEFDQETLEIMYQQSGGLPNLINQLLQKKLCDSNTEKSPPLITTADKITMTANRTIWQRNYVKIIALGCLVVLGISLSLLPNNSTHHVRQPIALPQIITSQPMATAESLPRANFDSAVTRPPEISANNFSRYTANTPKAQKSTISKSPTKAGYFTLQFIAAKQRNTVEEFRAKYPALARSHIIQITRTDGDWYALTFGHYANRANAIAASEKLPADLRTLHPWIKLTTY